MGEFNCSCVGISKCLPAYCKDDTPNASYDDIPPEDKAEAEKYGNMMGEKALAILSSPLESLRMAVRYSWPRHRLFISSHGLLL